jgi:hypothetical protein
MKVIYWRNLETGAEGHGEPVSDRIAEAWIEELKGKSGDFEYRACSVADAPEVG